jgi:hypothetical protein
MPIQLSAGVIVPPVHGDHTIFTDLVDCAKMYIR